MVKTILFCILLYTINWTLRAQTVENIFSQYVNALGGQQKIDSIQTIFTESVTDVGASKKDYRKRPNLYLAYLHDSVSELTVRTCNNGALMCLSDKKMGSPDTCFKLRLLKQAKKGYSLFFNSFLEYKQLGYNIVLVGKEFIEGKECFVVKVQVNDSIYDVYYIDGLGFLPVMQQTKYASGPDGPQIYHSDYRPVDGVMFPFVEEQSGGVFKKRVFKTIKVNVPIDDGVFVCPMM